MEIGHTFYSWSTFILMEAGFLLYVLSAAWISWYIFSTLFTIFRPIKSTLYSVFYMCTLNLHYCCHWSRSESARKSKSATTIISKMESASESELIQIQICVTCMCCPNLNFCCNWSQIAWRSKSAGTIIESEIGSSAMTVTSVNWSACIQGNYIRKVLPYHTM